MSSPTKINRGKTNTSKIGIETKMLLHLNLNQNNKVKFAEKINNINLSNCKKDEAKSSNAVEKIKNIPCRWSKHDNVDESGDSYRTDMIFWELELLKPIDNGRGAAPPQEIPVTDTRRSPVKFEDGTSSWGPFEFLENGLSHLGSLSLDNHENLAFSRCGSIVSIDCPQNEDRNDLIFELEL
jgi:hypothetical protein